MSYNILIVDDSSVIRKMVKKTLEIAEVPIKNLFEASNGKEALDILDKNWVDIVFADINMPVMTGIEMVEKMSESDIISKIPVIIISSDGSEERIAHLRELGIKGYLRKPFQPEDIRDIVNKFLKLEGV